MLKKAVTIFLVLSFIFFNNTKTSLAQGVAPGTANQCPRGYVGCFSGSTKTCYPASQGCPAGSTQQTSAGQTNQNGSTNTGNSGSNTSGVSDPTCNGTGIDTAIGCVNVLSSPEAFAGDLLKWGIGVGGGIAFLLIVYAGFMIMSSSGNPERLKAGQELMTSAISGVVLLVLSIFILNLIGIKILQIPGFGSNMEVTRVGQPR